MGFTLARLRATSARMSRCSSCDGAFLVGRTRGAGKAVPTIHARFQKRDKSTRRTTMPQCFTLLVHEDCPSIETGPGRARNYICAARKTASTFAHNHTRRRRSENARPSGCICRVALRARITHTARCAAYMDHLTP